MYKNSARTAYFVDDFGNVIDRFELSEAALISFLIFKRNTDI